VRGTIDLALVPAFVEVVRQGSFTAAATELELPKSTVSRRVSRLESQLGVQLLLRTTRQLRLTEAGEGFYARVARVLEGVEEAARALAEEREVPRGVLRISVPPDFERLPELVTSFVARYPEVRVEVSAAARFVDLVAEGYDLAIRAGQLDDSSLIARRLSGVEMQLFASHEYLERRGTPESVEALADHDFVLFRPRHGVNTFALEGPDGQERIEVTGPVAADDLLFIRGAVLAGAGIGMLPRYIFGAERERVVRLLPAHCVVSAGASVHLVYPAARHVPARVRAFRDHLLESLPWYGEEAAGAASRTP